MIPNLTLLAGLVSLASALPAVDSAELLKRERELPPSFAVYHQLILKPLLSHPRTGFARFERPRLVSALSHDSALQTASKLFC